MRSGAGWPRRVIEGACAHSGLRASFHGAALTRPSVFAVSVLGQRASRSKQ